MRLWLLLIFSLSSFSLWGASCCVSNTSVPNLIILPAKWQQTFMLAQTTVIGDVDARGKSIFRDQSKNKEATQFGRLDLSYSWTFRYQTGISLRYQSKVREFNGTEAKNAGWSDIGLSHAYMPKMFDRVWIYQTLNLPTAKSVYNSQSSLAVDAQGTGTYLTSVGIFKIHNYRTGDFTFGSEVHRSFPRKFNSEGNELDVRGAWGGSVSLGAGYVPWKSKSRFGVNITPRVEGPKTVVNNQSRVSGKQSMVWDTVINYTYSINLEYALGLTYLDQTILGPASNTLLNRTFGFVFQSRY
jgi:hypothetical protein